MPEAKSFSKQQLGLLKLAPPSLRKLLRRAKSFRAVTGPEIRKLLNAKGDKFVCHSEVDGEQIPECEVVHGANGWAVNYFEKGMQTRNPNSMTIAIPSSGGRPSTEKPTFTKRFGYPFTDLEVQTYDDLASKDLLVVPILAAGIFPGFVIVEKEFGFFGHFLDLLQWVVPLSKITSMQQPCRLVLYLAPKFRHTHFNGEQIVVHRESDTLHEIFGYHLYPGPSAKKGIYTFLLDVCRRMKVPVPVYHSSVVVCVTPAGHFKVVFMHHGASGSGKSEMGQYLVVDADGRVLLGLNILTGDELRSELHERALLLPVADDIVLALNQWQTGRKLVIQDAENGWFFRTDGFKHYCDDLSLGPLVAHGKDLAFLNLTAIPGATILPWDHFVNADGVVCPNPRVFVQRSNIPRMVDGQVAVDVCSWGIRTPPTMSAEYRERYNAVGGRPPITSGYGHIGMMHMLPPALWLLWFAIAPRGFANPSIQNPGDGLTSEGVGSYGPFNSGNDREQFNAAYHQLSQMNEMRYPLFPVGHIGAWNVRNTAQQVGREYLAVRSRSPFDREELAVSKDPLLGYRLRKLHVHGVEVPRYLLNPEHQLELGEEGCAEASKNLTAFFKREAARLLGDSPGQLNAGPRNILQACLDGASVEEWDRLLHPGSLFRN